MRRRLIDLADGQAACVEFGPPDRPLDIIFLHANGFNAMTYRHALAPLGDAWRVLATDLRGHGRSTLPPKASDAAKGQGWRVFAADLQALVAALGQRPRVVAGHSMGATTALLAAPALLSATSPGKLKDNGGMQLVLFDPVIAPAGHYAVAFDVDQPLAAAAARRKDFFASPAAALAAYRGRGAFRTWPDAALEDYLEDGLRPGPEGGYCLACPPAWEAANFAAYCVADPRPGLAACAGKLRVLQAESGSTCSIDRADAPTVPEIVAGTTHFLPIERPDIVQAALRRAAAG